MKNLAQDLEIWFVTGSQHLYGPKALKQVAANSQKIVEWINASSKLPLTVVFKPVVATPDEVTNLLSSASNDAAAHRRRSSYVSRSNLYRTPEPLESSI